MCLRGGKKNDLCFVPLQFTTPSTGHISNSRKTRIGDIDNLEQMGNHLVAQLGMSSNGRNGRLTQGIPDNPFSHGSWGVERRGGQIDHSALPI
jgi:hypothetical protein